MLMPTRAVNALTIDVEDYFQVSAMAPYIARSEWDRCECRVERNVDRILTLLAERGIHATFFTLGWVAERYPALVRRIVAQGHEIASHGYGHQRVTDLSEAAFREDVTRSKALLEDLSGTAVLGYRAPSFSIEQAIFGRSTYWNRRATDTAPAFTPCNMITTACQMRRVLPTGRGPACLKCHQRPCACSTATCPPAAEATSVCSPMHFRAGCCKA